MLGNLGDPVRSSLTPGFLGSRGDHLRLRGGIVEHLLLFFLRSKVPRRFGGLQSVHRGSSERLFVVWVGWEGGRTEGVFDITCC